MGRFAAKIGVITAMLVLATATGCAAEARVSPPAAPPPPPSFTMTGSVRMELAYPAGFKSDDGLACYGINGFSDMSPDSAVVVQNAQAQTVATGKITIGAVTKADTSSVGMSQDLITACTMLWQVDGVPDGLPQYTVSIGHRGAKVLSNAEAHENVQWTLGAG